MERLDGPTLESHRVTSSKLLNFPDFHVLKHYMELRMPISQTRFKDKNRYSNNDDESVGGDGCALFSCSPVGKQGCLGS